MQTTSESKALEFIPELDKIVEDQLPLLKAVENCWQPTDLLPDLTHPDWRDQVSELREAAARLPDDLLVALVGNTITEEALPTYQTWLNRYPSMKDETGVDSHPWALWTRAWTAEENRHGDALNRYLYLTGRINMRSFEVTTQYLLRRGFDTKTGSDPFMSLVYPAFQERATRISHANVSRMAEEYGDPSLSRMCQLITGDEVRHEEVYKRIFGRVVELYPSEGVMAFYKMMKQRIAMPANLMSDGTGRDLYGQYTAVAQKIGVYTARDYAEVTGHLVAYWKIADIPNLCGEEAKAQDYLCGLPQRYAKKAEIIQKLVEDHVPQKCQWLFEGAENR